MAIIDTINCAVKAFSVGFNFSCDVKRERIMGLIIAPRGFEVPLASAGTFEDILEYLQQASVAADKTKRVYPLTRPLFGSTDNTAEPAELTSGYGNLYGYNEDPKKFQFEMDNYGYHWWKGLQSLNGGGNWTVYLIDKTFIEGQLTSTGFAGFDATLHAQKPQFDGTNGVRHYLYVALTNPLAMGSIGNVLQFPYDGYDISKELNGITGLQVTATGASLSAKVKLTTEIGGAPISAAMAAILKVPAAFNVRNTITGLAVVPTGVTYDDANWLFTLVLPAGTFDITLASAEALLALGVGTATQGGYEAANVAKAVVVTA